MSHTAQVVALIIAIAMFCFSVWIFSRTGDWVAAVFALGSVAYAIFFFPSRGQ